MGIGFETGECLTGCPIALPTNFVWLPLSSDKGRKGSEKAKEESMLRRDSEKNNETVRKRKGIRTGSFNANKALAPLREGDARGGGASCAQTEAKETHKASSLSETGCRSSTRVLASVLPVASGVRNSHVSECSNTRFWWGLLRAHISHPC